MASNGITFDSIGMHPPQRPKHKRNKSSVLKALVSPIGHKRNTSENNFYKNDDSGAGKQNGATRAVIPTLQRYHSDDVFMRPTMMKNVQSHVMLSSDSNGGNISKPMNTAVQARGGAHLDSKRPTADLAEVLHEKHLLGNGESDYGDWKVANGGAVKDKENSTPPFSAAALDSAQTPIFSQISSKKLMGLSAISTGIESLNNMQDVPIGNKGCDLECQGPKRSERPQSYQQLSTNDYPVEKGRDINRRALKVGNGNAGKPSSGEMRNGDQYQHRHLATGAPPRRPLSVASAQNVQCLAKSGLRADQSPTKLSRDTTSPNQEARVDYDVETVDAAFEEVLDARNIPEVMRQKMRSLSSSIKADFVRKHSSVMPTLAQGGESGQKLQSMLLESPTGKHATIGRVNFQKSTEQETAEVSPGKRSKTRSRTFTLGKGESFVKKHKADRSDISSGLLRVKETPELLSAKPLQYVANGIGSWGRSLKPPALPEDFVTYLRKVQKPEIVEVEKIHKLRLLLRNETVSWVNTFIETGGMAEILELVYRILEIEWREEHEDQLLHESLLCLKGLSTTDLAQQKLCGVDSKLFPVLLATLFDKEHKGPSEFTTRSIIINLLFAHLSSALQDKAQLASRAHTILSYLKDPQPEESSKPLEFILDMQQSRPYRVWCREITNVTKEVFWIFAHQLNVIPLDKTPRTEASSTQTSEDLPQDKLSYTAAFYPPPRPPVPAAPYVGGVEWDATNYLAAHLDLLNGILASLPTNTERNALRAELRLSGFEKVMGSSLRTCKEKFYGSVHAGLRTWVAAAAADGWSASDVRAGPKEEIMMMAAAATAAAGRKSPAKKKKSSNDDGSDMVRVAVQPLMLELDSTKGRSGLDFGVDLGLGLDFQFDLKEKEKQPKMDESTG